MKYLLYNRIFQENLVFQYATVASQTRCTLLHRHHVPSTPNTCLQELGGSCFPEFVAYTQDVNQHAEQIKAPLMLLHCTL